MDDAWMKVIVTMARMKRILEMVIKNNSQKEGGSGRSRKKHPQR